MTLQDGNVFQDKPRFQLLFWHVSMHLNVIRTGVINISNPEYLILFFSENQTLKF